MSSIHLFAVAACVALSACGPDSGDPVPTDAAERYAEVMCRTYERCQCLRETHDDLDECTSEARSLFRTIEAWPGVKFDAACFEKVLDYLETEQCTGPLDEHHPFIPCLAFTGGQGIGQSCMPDWEGPWPGYGGLAASPCGGGAFCYGRTCRMPPSPEVGLGEPCALELGVHCGTGQYCASDGVCRERVALGEPCDTPAACSGTHHYCAGLNEGDGASGTCAEQLTPGAACEPDAIRACGRAQYGYCSVDGVCIEQWPSVCEALSPSPDEYIASEWIPIQ